MIDPIIFQNDYISLHWYGVIVMVGVVLGSMLVERTLTQRGGNADTVWDALMWILPIGLLGARFWYIVNATLGGNRYYLDTPLKPIEFSLFGLIEPFTIQFPTALLINEGGLHIFGGFLFGGITLLVFLRRNKLDPWMFLDSVGPGLLVGQAVGRLGNFVNQELYGPPTTLPWGIPIEEGHRLPMFQDMNEFPFETTRFHPTFAYEMIWNFAAASLLLWAARRYEKELKPGALFAGWLILAGIGRVFIEFFRPDQPKIEALGISYSMLVAALMAVAGAILLMARYRLITPTFAETWEEEYQMNVLAEDSDLMEHEQEDDVVVEEKPVKPRAKKAAPKKTSQSKAPAKKTVTSKKK